jgi:hypothetical protein
VNGVGGGRTDLPQYRTSARAFFKSNHQKKSKSARRRKWESKIEKSIIILIAFHLHFFRKKIDNYHDEIAYPQHDAKQLQRSKWERISTQNNGNRSQGRRQSRRRRGWRERNRFCETVLADSGMVRSCEGMQLKPFRFYLA